MSPSASFRRIGPLPAYTFYIFNAYSAIFSRKVYCPTRPTRLIQQYRQSISRSAPLVEPRIHHVEELRDRRRPRHQGERRVRPRRAEMLSKSLCNLEFQADLTTLYNFTFSAMPRPRMRSSGRTRCVPASAAILYSSR